MKRFFKYALILCAGLITLSLIFLIYSGLFSNVEFVEGQMGPYTVAYQEFIGDYSKTGPVFEKIYKDLDDMGIKTTRGIGIYYDNPKTTPREQCRSEVGVIVEQATLEVVKTIREAYEIKILNDGIYLIAEFPYKNKLSIILGVFKVYPKMEKIIKEKKYMQKEVIEIYDHVNKKILYLMKI